MAQLSAILYLALLGVAAHFIGNALPRVWFDARRFPYKCYSWEKEGTVYRKLGVHNWKDRVPDMSKLCHDMRPKTVWTGIRAEDAGALVAETCVAECVHWALILLSPAIVLISPGVFGTVLLVVDVLLFNLPFIVIQRYNRPKLLRLYDRLLKKEKGAVP